MLHSALCWPKVADQSNWPSAMSHAVYLHNHLPDPKTGLSPAELWSRTKFDPDHHPLKSVHVWGCPAYVLSPKLCEGGKAPKWEPRSQRGQYLGHSPMHSSNVALVKNLQTGHIIPQYYVTYDDWFSTVHAGPNEQPPRMG